MKKLRLLLIVSLLFVFTTQIEAQTGFSDSFNDSNFTANPVWTGEVGKFVVNATKELQLNNLSASSNNETFLTTNSSVINDAFWEFYVRLNFDPSSSNFAKVYLVSNNQDLTAALNGYYVQIGGQSGTVDDVRLYRQDGLTDSLLIQGLSNTVGSAPAVKIRVTKDAANLWSLFLDQSGVGSAYQLQGVSTENKYNSSLYFGVLCDYTSTRSDKFFFDGFLVSGASFQDTVKPILTQVTPVGDRKIEVRFNEKLDSLSALNLANYTVDNGIGNPSNASFITIDSTTIELDFSTPFSNGSSYVLTAQNIEDKAGNSIQSSTQSFTYFVAVPADFREIVINELYPDFSPTNGLPEAEFVELFNASNKVFDLNGWVISDGTSNGILTTHILRPGDYLTLCSQTIVRDFQAYGAALGLQNFPSLNNTGDAITLKDNSGNTIDFVDYNDTWYQDATKKDGGFSLERINPFSAPCYNNNFIGSSANLGGTPGTQNSAFDTVPDLTPPAVIELLALSDSSISIRFDKLMDSASVVNGSYSFSPSIPIKSVNSISPNFEEVILQLDSKLSFGVFYELEVSNVSDCSGNTIANNIKLQILLPYLGGKDDIIINEILFNSRSGSSDFVELYNRSEKIISLENWKISNVNDSSVAELKVITDNPILLYPKEYLVLTEDKADIIQQYPTSIAENIFEIRDLPTYNDDEGAVYIFNANQQLIDKVEYKDDYHFALLIDDDGVSLERINSEKSSLDESNWHSASEKVGFASPGYKNSQDFTNPKSSGTVTIEPNIISPDNDGLQDILSINYKLTSPGFVANVSILDRNGRLIKKLVNNELLGSEGSFFWDGISDDNNKAKVGIHVVLFEIFNLNGDKEVFKEVITVASRLK